MSSVAASVSIISGAQTASIIDRRRRANPKVPMDSMISAVSACMSYQAGLGRALVLDQDQLAGDLTIMHIGHSSDLPTPSWTTLPGRCMCQA
jgi:hypothetical protein